MALIRWSPWSEYSALTDRMNRLFNDTLRTPGTETEAELGSAWYPVVDIYEKDDNIALEAELPGLAKEDIDVRVENNVLTLRGERKLERETKKNGSFRSERAYGTFSRSFTLPTTVATDKIQAAYKDGILTLMLPRAEEAKPKQIPVKVA